MYIKTSKGIINALKLKSLKEELLSESEIFEHFQAQLKAGKKNHEIEPIYISFKKEKFNEIVKEIEEKSKTKIKENKKEIYIIRNSKFENIPIFVLTN